MEFGYVEDVTHDYKRHASTTLFEVLNALNGSVLASCTPRHRYQEFLAFLCEINKAVLNELDSSWSANAPTNGTDLAGPDGIRTTLAEPYTKSYK